MGGDPLESWKARTAVGPTGLEGATGGGSPTVYRSGGALGHPLRVGQARSSYAAPTSLSDTSRWGGNFNLLY